MAERARSPVTGRYMKQEQLDLATKMNEVANKQLDTEKQLGKAFSFGLGLKKDRLNKIVATYIKYKPLTETKRREVIKGVLKGLYKK